MDEGRYKNLCQSVYNVLQNSPELGNNHSSEDAKELDAAVITALAVLKEAGITAN